MTNKQNAYKETSPIKCPQCGADMDLVVEGDKKTGKCKHCKYEEPNHNTK